jgi:hypothetical protein
MREIADCGLRVADSHASLALRVALFLCVFGWFASLARAEQLWYEAYDEGVKAIQEKNWSLAEQKFKDAIRQQPKPGKKIRAYGTRFITYIPDYYLGVAYLNQGRYQEAQVQLQKAQASGVISSGDPEFSQIPIMLQKIDQQLKPAVVETKPPPGPSPEELKAQQSRQEIEALIQKAKAALSQGQLEDAKKAGLSIQEKDPSNKVATDLLSQIAQKEAELRAKAEEQQKKADEEKKAQQFAGLFQQANQAMQAKRFAQARSLGKQASDLGVDDAKVLSLIKSIDIAETTDALQTAVKNTDWAQAQSLYTKLSALDAKNATLLTVKPAIDQGLSTLKVEEVEQRGLVAFYSGEYLQAAALLERVVAQKNDSARAYFYLGCSQAGLGLLKEKERPAYLQKAKQFFAQARKLDASLRVDRRYISPRILQIYEQ